MAPARTNQPRPPDRRASVPSFFHLIWLAVWLVIQTICWSGCRPKRDKDESADICTRIVDRSIHCIELEVLSHETDDFSAKERLERARIHRKESIASCRQAINHPPFMKKALSSCLDKDNCMDYRRCRQTVSLRGRVTRTLSALTDIEDANEQTDGSSAARALCRDRYLFEALKAQDDPESRRLVEKLQAACGDLRRRRLSAVKQRLDQAFAPGNRHPISDLSRICSEFDPERTDRNPRSGSPVSRSAERRAIEELCREQWRLRSILSHMRKIRSSLQPPGCAECALRFCRSIGLAKSLTRSPLNSVRSLARRFVRLCRVDAPLFWIRNRISRKQRPGPITCRRATSLLGKARSTAPDDPMVQLTSCLVTLRCAQRR